MAIRIKKKAAHRFPEPAPVKSPPKSGKPNTKVLDGMCKAAMAGAPMSIVPWFLIASYTYYHHDLSVLSDGMYDELATTILEQWDNIEHVHKYLITKDDLQAGSMYRLKAEDYPNSTKGAASHLVRQEWGIKLNIG